MGGHSSGGLFGPTLGNNAAPLESTITVVLPPDNETVRPISNPIVDAIRTGSALKLDKDHAFPDIVDNYAGYAHRFNLVGNDGKSRSLYQLKGSLNGIEGIFEWIVDPDPAIGVAHRRFIGGGRITGRPNQAIRKARR